MILVVGVLVVLLTVMLHAVMIAGLIALFQRHDLRLKVRLWDTKRALILGLTACSLTLKHAVDILIWAAVFWFTVRDQLGDFENAYYFSTVTYTTLGYGDVVLVGRWRLLCSFEAMSGMLLFGLSTAILFAVVQRIWLDAPDRQRIEDADNS